MLGILECKKPYNTFLQSCPYTPLFYSAFNLILSNSILLYYLYLLADLTSRKSTLVCLWEFWGVLGNGFAAGVRST